MCRPEPGSAQGPLLGGAQWSLGSMLGVAYKESKLPMHMPSRSITSLFTVSLLMGHLGLRVTSIVTLQGATEPRCTSAIVTAVLPGTHPSHRVCRARLLGAQHPFLWFPQLLDARRQPLLKLPLARGKVLASDISCPLPSVASHPAPVPSARIPAWAL